MWNVFRPPGGGISLYAGLWIGLGLALVYLGLSAGRNDLLALGLPLFVLGSGLWLRKGWARWLSFWISALGVVAGVFVLGLKGWDTRKAFKVLMGILFMHSLWVWEVRPDDPEPETFLDDMGREEGRGG